MRFLRYIVLIFLFAACNETAEKTPSPIPSGLLTIHMDENARITFETSTGFSTPVPIDNPDSAANYLTLRVGTQDFYYDLGGQNFEIEFDSDTYVAVNGRKTGANYFLEAVTPATPSPTATENVTPVAECPDAPPTQFSVGDTVQVDFNSIGALQIRIAPMSDKIIRQVYDNEHLNLIEGPVCGIDRWVWKVYYAPADVTGWASEGVQGDPWMCPLENPECGN